MATSFSFPEIYDFPPFFTRQIHEETWQKQRKTWIELILAWSEARRYFELDPSAEGLLQMDLFYNPKIDRKNRRPFKFIFTFLCR